MNRYLNKPEVQGKLGELGLGSKTLDKLNSDVNEELTKRQAMKYFGLSYDDANEFLSNESNRNMTKMKKSLIDFKNSHDNDMSSYYNNTDEARKNKIKNLTNMLKNDFGQDFKMVDYQNEYGGTDDEGSWYWPTYTLKSKDYTMEVTFSGGYNQYIGVKIWDKNNHLIDSY